MPRIMLTEEQLQVIAIAGSPVEVVGPGHEPLGSLTVFSPEEHDAIVRFQRRSGTPIPGIPGERVRLFSASCKRWPNRGD